MGLIPKHALFRDCFFVSLKVALCRVAHSFFKSFGVVSYDIIWALPKRLEYSIEKSKERLQGFHFHSPAQETFICEVEVLKSEMTSCELVVEGEFASVLTMEEWGWSE